MFNGTIKVLVVEDDEVGQIAAKIALEKLGCVVDVATYGKDAIKMFKKNIYNLVFMDIAILDMDGFVITEKMRDIEKKQARHPTPILAISAYDEDSFKKRAMIVGIDHYLIKPVRGAQYREILNRFFGIEE